MAASKKIIIVIFELLVLLSLLFTLGRLIFGPSQTLSSIRKPGKQDTVSISRESGISSLPTGPKVIIEEGKIRQLEKIAEDQSALSLPQTPPLDLNYSLPTETPVPERTGDAAGEEDLPSESGDSADQKLLRSGTGWIEITPEVDHSFISNPGIGWQYYWSSVRVNTIPQAVAYGERDSQYWALLNPAEGVYDWSALDAYVDAAVADGEQFSFRVYSSSDTHKFPQWVLAAGAALLPNGDIDHNNCVYQEKWGIFVQALIDKYDGNPNIAYIDISGYGDFNEWSWESETEWDYVWAENYEAGTASSDTMSTMDSYSRRRLADMFIGGSYPDHQCKNPNGTIRTLSYDYAGFEETQLILPYAGIRQSTQYVYLKRPDVGFRYDSLGRDSSLDIISRLRHEISGIWPNAPVVLETSLPADFEYENARYLFNETHASLAHNAKVDFSDEEIVGLIQGAGYKYTILQAGFNDSGIAGGNIDVTMVWQNIGSAPAYPKMGQTMALHLFLAEVDGTILADHALSEDLSKWMPGTHSKDGGRGVSVEASLPLPGDLAAGLYHLKVGIINTRTGEPINLATTLDAADGLYQLGVVSISAP